MMKTTEAHDMASEQGWWLDVSSPSWDDMRSLGKVPSNHLRCCVGTDDLLLQLLRLHPLTLEDILHQEPREKLELFPKLGYYFVVFQALEGERSRERSRKLRRQDEGDSCNGPVGEGLLGSVNVYLVVFREGICSVRAIILCK